MGKSLVLAEKPSVGRDIARVLGCGKKSNSYHENDSYIITWALGHLITLAMPEKYNKKYEQWTLENLPILPDRFKLEIINNTSKQFASIRKLMERKDVTEIIIATDAGREGELVARWILEYAGNKKPIKRLWISSVTDKAIKDGFASLQDGKKYNNLYYAARARAKADWIVGLNGSRALTCKHNASLTMGRVQTPTLQLVKEREDEIRNFIPKTYYELSATVEGIRFMSYHKDTKNTRINGKEQAESLVQRVKKGQGIITNVEKKEKQSVQTGFYDLTKLQRDANKMYGFSAKHTLNVMQNLYERHKVLTYPRTDSKFITEDIVPTLRERVQACKRIFDNDVVSPLLKTPIKARKNYVNAKEVGDHHGIIPTEIEPDYTAFSNDEQKIYKLVTKRFIAVLLPPYRYEEITYEMEIDKIPFKGKGRIITEEGWKKVYRDVAYQEYNDEKREEEQIVSSVLLKKGQSIEKLYPKLEQKKTSPPSYLSEADLLYQMEKAGLGTVATRADIIEKIDNHQYVEKVGQSLRVTKTGRQLLALVPEDIKTKELTAKWERTLENIQKGKTSEDDFIKEMISFTKILIREIKEDTTSFTPDNLTTDVCPECGKRLLMVKNKYGKKLVCQDRNCSYKKHLSKTTNARCPQCHKKMELVGEKEKQTFICICGHKEKLEAFQKRKDGNKKAMSKKEVQKYLKKSQKEEGAFNNAFAGLLGTIETKEK